MVDKNGGAKPFWLFPVNFQFDKYKLQSDQRWDTMLLLCIKCRRSKLPFDKTVVGKVHIPVKLLLDDYPLNSPGNRSKNVSFTVLSRSGNSRGVIYLSYSFRAAKGMNTSLRLLPPPRLVPSAPPPLPPPRLVPSAPPLPEIENNGCNSQLLPTPPTPSAPYQSGKINSALIIFLIFCLFMCAFILFYFIFECSF